MAPCILCVYTYRMGRVVTNLYWRPQLQIIWKRDNWLRTHKNRIKHKFQTENCNIQTPFMQNKDVCVPKGAIWSTIAQSFRTVKVSFITNLVLSISEQQIFKATDVPSLHVHTMWLWFAPCCATHTLTVRPCFVFGILQHLRWLLASLSLTNHSIWKTWKYNFVVLIYILISTYCYSNVQFPQSLALCNNVATQSATVSIALCL